MAALGKIRSKGVILISILGFALLHLLLKSCSALVSHHETRAVNK